MAPEKVTYTFDGDVVSSFLASTELREHLETPSRYPGIEVRGCAASTALSKLVSTVPIWA